jgi:L-lactate dehydrogenase complex protein LldF
MAASFDQRRIFSKGENGSMKMMAATLSKPAVFSFAGKWGRKVMKAFPWMVNNKFNPWYKQRDLPAPPKESFTEWYKRNRK